MMDSLDNLKLPDASQFRQNPYYEEILKNGFTISVHYSAEDVSEIMGGKLRFDFDLLEHDPDELAAFERYRKSHQSEAV